MYKACRGDGCVIRTEFPEYCTGKRLNNFLRILRIARDRPRNCPASEYDIPHVTTELLLFRLLNPIAEIPYQPQEELKFVLELPPLHFR